MSIRSALRTLTLAAAGLCAGTASAQEFVYNPGPNNLDLLPDGSDIFVGIDPFFTPVPGVLASNTVLKSFNTLYSYSDSVTTLGGAVFSAEVLAFENSIINYVDGSNPALNMVTFDNAAINVSGGTVGFIGTGGGSLAGGSATISGGTVAEVAACESGAITVSGGTFNTPTYGLPFSFISFVPAGVTFVGSGVVADFQYVDVGNGFDGNVWKLSGTLSNGGSLEGLYMVDVGIFDPTVIVNYAGVTIRPADLPPVADAGVDFSVNEDELVALDGSASNDPDGDTLTYSWVQLAGGPTVTLSGANTATPSFTSPIVAFGGETLTFQLTVTANGVSTVDTVSVSVVNVNHVPEANAGPDQTVAEGAPVILDGSSSVDADNDVIFYSWTQIAGSPVVFLSNPNSVNPSFVAPPVGSGGAALVFELRVDDGFATEPGGYSESSVVDTVTITVTNLNGLPTAEAGPCETVNELTLTTLDGTDSTDPDSDVLSYSWVQISGPAVALTGATTATPSFTAPSVSGCTLTTLKFRLTVNDGYGGTDTDDVVIKVKNVGQPPDISDARPSECLLWPPNHQFECITIKGITSSNGGGGCGGGGGGGGGCGGGGGYGGGGGGSGGNVTITITGVTQDEPTNGLGDGDTAIDAVIKPNGSVLIRAERKGNGNGRVYHIHFTATNAAGSASGMVKVIVPKSKHSGAIDGGELYDSTQ